MWLKVSSFWRLLQNVFNMRLPTFGLVRLCFDVKSYHIIWLEMQTIRSLYKKDHQHLWWRHYQEFSFFLFISLLTYFMSSVTVTSSFTPCTVNITYFNESIWCIIYFVYVYAPATWFWIKHHANRALLILADVRGKKGGIRKGDSKRERELGGRREYWRGLYVGVLVAVKDQLIWKNQPLQRSEMFKCRWANTWSKSVLTHTHTQLMATFHLPGNQLACIKTLNEACKVWPKTYRYILTTCGRNTPRRKQRDSVVSSCCQGNQRNRCRSHWVEDRNAHTYIYTYTVQMPTYTVSWPHVRKGHLTACSPWSQTTITVQKQIKQLV